ncbi:MAG TPA: CaiB/BaiF CoA-transferase family protein [Burkholderiales bacterium]|nr:CaiB/BaiF CoA-transferase family protein [Burkholderiales bacterium]
MGPLEGLKVIELGQLIAGPFCTRVMAEFGAQVVKIESPAGGDPLRQWRKLYDGNSLWWLLQARNKQSVTVNLKSPEGQEVVRRLAKDADIVVENFRPGAMEKWGLGYEELSRDNPGLVMVRLSGYGQTGPYRDKPGFGSIGEAMGGLRHVTGYPDRPPVRVGISLGDAVASLYGVIGALMALRQREVNGGRGQVIDVALYEAVFSLMESLLPEYDVYDFVRERTGSSLPGIAPSNSYTTRDGKYVVIGANGDSIFKRMMKAIGRDDLADDPDLAKNDGRAARSDELDEAIGAWCGALDLDDVLAALDSAEVPAGKIYDIADIVKDVHFQARDMIQEAKLRGGKTMKIPGVVPKLTDTPGGTRWLGPELGEHTVSVLESIGYDATQIADMKSRGVV